MVLEELAECVPGAESTEQAVEEALLVEVLNGFLEELPVEKRKLFLRRYWFGDSVKDIAREEGMKESAVSLRLSRTREKLRTFLVKEGYRDA